MFDSDVIAGPYLMVTLPQLDAVRAVLDRHKVCYWVDADAISLDNEPAIDRDQFRQRRRRGPDSGHPRRGRLTAGRRAMPLSDDIRSLADRVLARLDEAREFYVHSRQAWRLVQQLARKGRPVGIVDLATKRPLPTGDLESRVEKYVTVRLAESTFRELSSSPGGLDPRA